MKKLTMAFLAAVSVFIPTFSAATETVQNASLHPIEQKFSGMNRWVNDKTFASYLASHGYKEIFSELTIDMGISGGGIQNNVVQLHVSLDAQRWIIATKLNPSNPYSSYYIHATGSLDTLYPTLTHEHSACQNFNSVDIGYYTGLFLQGTSDHTDQQLIYYIFLPNGTKTIGQNRGMILYRDELAPSSECDENSEIVFTWTQSETPFRMSFN